MSDEDSLNSKKSKSEKNVIEWIALFCAVGALLISTLGYFSSNKANSISKDALVMAKASYESQFKIFWEFSVLNNELYFKDLKGGQISQFIKVVPPSDLLSGFWQISPSERKLQVAVPEIEHRVLERFSKMREIFDETTIVTLTYPIGIETRFAAAGELQYDTSIYELVFKVEVPGNDSDEMKVIEYMGATFLRRVENEEKFQSALDYAWEETIINFFKYYDQFKGHGVTQ